MRLLTLTVPFLMSAAICSCRAVRQSVSETADSAAVEISRSETFIYADSLFSLIKSSRGIDLYGITVEFFPPDSTGPCARAAPRSLSIDNAKIMEQAAAASMRGSVTKGMDTTTVRISEHSVAATKARSVTERLRPPNWMLVVSMVGAAIMVVFILYRIRSKLSA